MTRDEFLYEHDVIGISEMINQVIKNDDNNTTDSGAVRAVDFL